MKRMKWYDVALQIVLAVMLTVLFLSSSVFFTLAFRPLYYIDMQLLSVRIDASNWGVELTDAQIKENYDALIDYNLPLSDGYLSFPSLDMSDDGRQHFAEVKDIFDAFKVAAIVSLPLSVVGIVYFRKEKNKFYLPLTTGLCVGLPLLGGGLIALNWDRVFVTFHEIFFDNDKWIFNPYTDPVITILPDEFFMHCAIMILSLVVLEGVGCLVAFFILRKGAAKKAKKENETPPEPEKSEA